MIGNMLGNLSMEEFRDGVFSMKKVKYQKKEIGKMVSSFLLKRAITIKEILCNKFHLLLVFSDVFVTFNFSKLNILLI